VFKSDRIAFLEERVRRLEEQNLSLWREKTSGIEALDAAVSLGHFDTSMNKLNDPLPILRETIKRIRSIIPLRAAAVYLVGPDSSFAPSLCSPSEALPEVESAAERLIEDRTFSWAIKRKKPVFTGLGRYETPLLLHVLSTISRTRGMLVGILDRGGEDISDSSLSLLSVTLSASAGALESFELYSSLRVLNAELSNRMEQLEESRNELQRYRTFLEEQVEARTRELARANDEMKMEIAERMRAEEELRSNETMLKHALEGVGEGLWMWDTSSGEVELSPLTMEILGCAADASSCPPEMRTMEGWETLILQDDAEKVRYKKNKCLSGDVQGYSVEYRVADRNREVRWILERGRVVLRDGEGRPLRIAGTHSDVTERRRLEDQIRYQATHDYLTGLPNRYLFSDRLSQAIAQARRKDRKVALLFIDLDNFKVVNDTYGHDVGDDLLRDAAVRMEQVFREMDTVCRLGGDEFTVILPEPGDRSGVEKIAERLLEAFKIPFSVSSHTIMLEISVGISIFPDDGLDIEMLLKKADLAMYRTKEDGKSAFAFASDVPQP